MKRRRAGHLGEVRKGINRVHELMEQNAKEEGVIMSLSCYETAFHKFVNAHEAYSPFEDGKNEKALAEESYENVKESKYLLDIDINKCKSKIKRVSKSRKSNHSVRSQGRV